MRRSSVLIAGDESPLHIIIFDEIDAICKSRGSTKDGTGVHDTIVNQLLTKIDGVDALNNILLIGMTNRRDMLDEALLRSAAAFRDVNWSARLDDHVPLRCFLPSDMMKRLASSAGR